MASENSGMLKRFGGEAAGRIASAACAATVLILTIATVAMKKDGEPLLESILIVSVLGGLWNAAYCVHPPIRASPIYRSAVKLQVDRLLCVLWVASVPAMVTSYVYTKDNFRASKEGSFDIVRVLTVWSTILGFLPQFWITLL
ncbi:hypothetical protein MAA_11619 [Metarhizium robertsii ARSEF 23]|uniref:Uncharacterized protein n=1 Tax=Metarhizium robertsii (strain ARSEF 23 / ATCC MYA-3075) TaxID=655844 RepID=A0A0B2X790_METRA|nr:uncharacterized protein MAA_11619 [Metarhizium robertsii ARSEF 23]KHO10773.1 hypothetical protein MAA_11619 [Metarhizium robertsii ARSEF 23]